MVALLAVIMASTGLLAHDFASMERPQRIHDFVRDNSINQPEDLNLLDYIGKDTPIDIFLSDLSRFASRNDSGGYGWKHAADIKTAMVILTLALGLSPPKHSKFRLAISSIHPDSWAVDGHSIMRFSFPRAFFNSSFRARWLASCYRFLVT